MSSYSLNIFQRLTRQWDALHPYNAAQLIRLPGKADCSSIESNWRDALRHLGLGTVHVSRGRYSYQPPGEGESLLHIAPSGTNLDWYLTDEMNRPFGIEDRMPFRPFVLAQENSYYFGVVYHHWIADSVSIRNLLRQWFLRHFDPEAVRAERHVDQSPAGYWKLFGPDARQWDLSGAILDVGRWSSKLRRVRRVESERFPDMKIRFSLHRLRDGLVDRLLPVARDAHATMNDLFLAAMAEACDRYVATPPTSRRHDLALGVIADLRGNARSLQDVFGLYLGFTSVLCRFGELRNWDQLVQSIAAQSRQQKRERVPESSMVRLFAGLVTGKLVSRRQLLEFYRKRLPLAAGISNVNLNRTWVSHYHPDPILEYIRVSPTGPMLPLVFTPSTLGHGMHFGLTQRAAVVPPSVADACATEFTSRLSSLVHEQPVLKLPKQREAS